MGKLSYEMLYVLILLFDIKNNFDTELKSNWEVFYYTYDRVQKPLYFFCILKWILILFSCI